MHLSTLRRLGIMGPARANRRGARFPLEVSVLEGRMMLAADITAPVTAAAVVNGTLGTNGFYTTPITVDLTASDPDSPSGLTTFFNVDNAGFVSGNVVALGDGSHTVQFYSVDASNNQEAVHTQTFNVDTTAPVVTAVASPTSLWPPNQAMVPVTVTGHVTDASGGVPTTVSYHVVDEYGRVQPTGTATVGADGNYSFTVPLQASRQGQDRDGRQYTIVVTATDQAGNTGSAMAVVVVPHDQGHHTGGGNGGGHGTHGHGGNGQGNHGHGQGNQGHGQSDGSHGHSGSQGQGGDTGGSDGSQHGQGNQGHGHGHG